MQHLGELAAVRGAPAAAPAPTSGQPRRCAWCGVSIDHRNGKAQFYSKEHSDLAWVARNPERVLANARRHQRSDTGRAYRQTYQREHLAQRRQWARGNRRRAPERYRAYWKSWAQANQEVLGFAARTRHSRKRNNGGGPWIGVSLREWQRLVRRYRGCCAYFGVLASPVSVDHVIHARAPCDRRSSRRCRVLDWRHDCGLD